MAEILWYATKAIKSQAKPAFGPGLRLAARPRLGEPGRQHRPSLPQVGLWSRTMPSCGRRPRAPGPLSASTCPELRQTNPRLACNNITADDVMVVAHLELETKIDDHMEDSVLDSMWVKAILSGLTLT